MRPRPVTGPACAMPATTSPTGRKWWSTTACCPTASPAMPRRLAITRVNVRNVTRPPTGAGNAPTCRRAIANRATRHRLVTGLGSVLTATQSITGPTLTLITPAILTAKPVTCGRPTTRTVSVPGAIRRRTGTFSLPRRRLRLRSHRCRLSRRHQRHQRRQNLHRRQPIRRCRHRPTRQRQRPNRRRPLSRPLRMVKSDEMEPQGKERRCYAQL
jgi:hypothetical protein